MVLLIVLILNFSLLIGSGIAGFKYFYHDWLNQNATRISKNIKFTPKEQQFMLKHQIKNGWFGYLYTDDNELSVPLYAGYAQWILNAGFGEVPTPNAQIGKDTFCVASHEYLINGAFTNYGFSQLQFETHKGEIVHVDTPNNWEYNYMIVKSEVKSALAGGDIIQKNYGQKVAHIDKPVMMMYTCYSPSRYDPLPDPPDRYIVTSVLVSKHKIPKSQNRFYHRNLNNKKKDNHWWNKLIDWLNNEWLNFLFKQVKLQKYIQLNDNGQTQLNQ